MTQPAAFSGVSFARHLARAAIQHAIADIIVIMLMVADVSPRNLSLVLPSEFSIVGILTAIPGDEAQVLLGNIPSVSGLAFVAQLSPEVRQQVINSVDYDEIIAGVEQHLPEHAEVLRHHIPWLQGEVMLAGGLMAAMAA